MVRNGNDEDDGEGDGVGGKAADDSAAGANGDPGDGGELYDEMERRALFAMPDEDEGDEAPVDVVDVLRGNGGETPAHDVTLGGYIDTHNRVPAFEGADGQPYTVDIDTDATGDAERPFAAFLVFIRWAATGAGIMDHVESGDVASGATAEEARRGALELSLYEVKAELDAAIGRRQKELED